MKKVAVLGSGTWGTALAQVLNDNGHNVIIYGNSKDQIDDINNNHKNSFYFGNDIILDKKLKGTTELSIAIKDVDIILVSVPSGALRSVLSQVVAILDHPVIFINTAKGFDTEKDQRISQLFKEVIPSSKMKAFVSLIGPSHAEEVIVRDLTCICAVSLDKKASEEVAKVFSNKYLRVYTNNDEIGSEIGVAMKNAIAIASGILEGLNYGDNARAALCTRGLAEIVRFGSLFGANPTTYLGLTGLGDLIVTCYSFHSRNFTAGMEIGKANSAKEFMENNTKTVEGIRTINVIKRIANEKKIELPIIDSLYRIIYEDKLPSKEIDKLMLRPLKGE